MFVSFPARNELLFFFTGRKRHIWDHQACEWAGWHQGERHRPWPPSHVGPGGRQANTPIWATPASRKMYQNHQRRHRCVMLSFFTKHTLGFFNAFKVVLRFFPKTLEDLKIEDLESLFGKMAVFCRKFVQKVLHIAFLARLAHFYLIWAHL